MSRPRKKKSRNKKLAMLLVAEIFVFVCLIGGYGWYYVNHAMDQIIIDDTPKEEIDVSEAVTETMKEKYTTIALFGLDTRDNVDMTKEGMAHSDAVIIASINNETKEVKLVSVYRDCFLEIVRPTPDTQKYTHAYFLGGPTCAMETLNKNLDLNITDYVSVDFKALTKAIDALGGITIDVKSNEIGRAHV